MKHPPKKSRQAMLKNFDTLKYDSFAEVAKT